MNITNKKSNEDNSLSIIDFDYSSLDANTAKLAKESAIEIKAREKAIWENIIEIGNRLIEVKNALPRGRFDDWVKCEFKWGRTTAYKYIKVSKELGGIVQESVRNFEGFDPLYALASEIGNADEQAKEEILTAVESKTEEKGKALTEKEIKELVAEKLGKVKKILSNPREAIKHTNEDLADQFSLPLDVVAQTRENIELKRGEEILKEDRTFLENKVKDLEKTLDNQNKDIQEKNSRLSQLENKEKDLKKKEEELNKIIETTVIEQVNETIKPELENINKQKAELEKKKAEIKKELKEAERLKKSIEANKRYFDDVAGWTTSLGLTNNHLQEMAFRLSEDINDLRKPPDLSNLSEEDRNRFNSAIEDLIIEFNSAMEDLGKRIYFLNDSVAKFNRNTLRIVEAEVKENE